MVRLTDGSMEGVYTTDELGEIRLTLPEGTYSVEEVSVPNNIILDGQKQEIYLSPGSEKSLLYENTRKPTLIITKLSGLDYQPISNTTINIKYENPDGGIEDLGNYRTGADGKIILKNQRVGWYICEEVMPAPGYNLPSDPITRIYLSAGENSYTDEELGNGSGSGGSDSGVEAHSGYDYMNGTEIYNWPKNSIVVKKSCAITSQLLEGATFELYKVSGQESGTGGTLVKTATTDSSGIIVFVGLDAGAGYIVRETIPPSLYTLDENNEQQAWLKADATSIIELSFRNHPYGSIHVTKVNAQNSSEVIPNVSFQVVDSSGAAIGNANGIYVTDENGEFLVSGIKPGTSVVITELDPGPEWAKDTTPQTVLIGTDGSTHKLTFKNQPAGTLVLRKWSSADNSPLANAEILVKYADGTLIGDNNGIFRTNAQGTVIIPGVYGSIVCQEVKAPDNYVLSQQTQTIFVGYNETKSLDFYNAPMGGLLVHKYGVDEQGNRSLLPGITMRVVQKNGEHIGDYTTGVDGTFSIPYLAPGWYSCYEVDTGNTGYHLDPTPKDFQFTAEGEMVTLEFVNYKLGAIHLKKISSVDRSPIPNISFTLSKVNGERVGDTYKTSATGEIFIDGLEAGTYVLQEVKNEGYEPDTEPRLVQVELGKTVFVEWENTPVSSLLIYKTSENDSKPLKGVIFEIRKDTGELVGNEFETDSKGRIYVELPAGNYHITEKQGLPGFEADDTIYKITVRPGQQEILRVKNKELGGLRLYKVNSVTQQGIPDVEFRIYDFYSNKEVAGPFITDDQGVIEVSTGILPEGRYKLYESREASGYLRDTSYKTIEIKSGKILEVRWENTPMMGQIQITKLSASDNEINGLSAGTRLEGAVYEVYNHKTGNLVDQFKTGPNGVGVSQPLPLGRYRVKEVVAPSYYKISDIELDVEIEFSGQILKFEMTNEPANTGVSIRKVGPEQTMANQQIKYEFKQIQNTSTVPLSDFYFRDIIPVDAVRLDTIVTGTFNQSLKYKILYKTNLNDYRVMADNLSTTQNNVVDARPAAIGLYGNEYVTEIMVVFGSVQPGFCQVENPVLFMTVRSGLPNGFQFGNRADVGGKYGEEWIIGNTTWVTTVYSPTEKLPKTGY